MSTPVETEIGLHFSGTQLTTELTPNHTFILLCLPWHLCPVMPCYCFLARNESDMRPQAAAKAELIHSSSQKVSSLPNIPGSVQKLIHLLQNSERNVDMPFAVSCRVTNRETHQAQQEHSLTLRLGEGKHSYYKISVYYNWHTRTLVYFSLLLLS